MGWFCSSICILSILTTVVVGRSSFNLVTLGDPDGVLLLGPTAGSYLGQALSSAGDFNNDGKEDFLVTAAGWNSNRGIIYVIFSPIQLVMSDLGGFVTSMTTGFTIRGANTNDNSGFSASTAGDVNNDGIDDIVIGGMPQAGSSYSGVGQAYVLFGRTVTTAGNAFQDVFLLAFVSSVTLGFRISGVTAADWCGYAVGPAGDVNNDGIDDIIIGAPGATVASKVNAGIVYVIYGRVVNPANDIALSSLSGTSPLGFRVLGARASDYIGNSVTKAGDVNGDDIMDIIIGAASADSATGVVDAGAAYVIFGKSDFSEIDLATMISGPSTGFSVIGIGTSDLVGESVSAAGDINGDGLADVLIGARQGDPAADRLNAGITYVIFGRATVTDISLSQMVSGLTTGYRILGAMAGDGSGVTVCGRGDFNGDGFRDIMIGAPNAFGGKGMSYVLYGPNSRYVATFTDIELSSSSLATGSKFGFSIFGASSGDTSGAIVQSAGDINGDGADDMLIAAKPSSPFAVLNAGVVYLVFGQGDTPTSQPSSQPTRQPSPRPSAQPSSHPSRQPSSQPSRRPTSQPSAQPTRQSSSQPSSAPSGQPSVQPTARPTGQPVGHPSSAPTSQPQSRPTSQPSASPSSTPTTQPSTHPSMQPSSQPTSSPSTQPSSSPSAQPSSQPSSLPTRQPSRQPTAQPTQQPTARPSAQPSARPTVDPSSQPSQQPTSRPSAQPSAEPSMQPTSTQPSALPTTQPTSLPSGQPSSVPSMQPSAQPSAAPTTAPSAQPSAQPTNWPSAVPTVQPSARPSVQPSAVPTQQPTSKPSAQPTDQPTSNPSTQPSTQPTAQPSRQPTTQPSTQPSTVPSVQPTTQPSYLPSSAPSGFPSSKPTTAPSMLPTAQPTIQPSSQPTVQPSRQPSEQPTEQPTVQPTAQPSAQPTSVPSAAPPVGEWVATTSNKTSVTYVQNSVWACSESMCTIADAPTGTIITQYSLPWDKTVCVLAVSGGGDSGRVLMHGVTASAGHIATCAIVPASVMCTVETISDVLLYAAASVPFAVKVVYVGRYNVRTAIVIKDMIVPSVVLNLYAVTTMKAFVLTHVVSPPHFVGAFVAGTSARATGTGAVGIVLGMVRTDQGMLSAMSLYPVSGEIVDSVDLVTATTLESTTLESFVVGGLSLSDGVNGKHAYLLRANGLFMTVKYCVRYRSGRDTGRRLLSDTVQLQSISRGVVLVEAVIYMVLDVHNTLSNATSVTALKADGSSGKVLQEVHLHAANGSLRCSDLTTTGSALVLSCNLQTGDGKIQSLLIAADLTLTFSALPVNVVRNDSELFHAETVPFQRTVLSVTKQTAGFAVSESVYNSEERAPSRRPSTAPTMQPSSQPSSAPSAQPSSSPTATPTVSARPTSQPSSAVPTITHKPTVAPSPRPSLRPSLPPTAGPTALPTLKPTVSPTVPPSASSSLRPSVRPTPYPTKIPSTKPTCAPKPLPTMRPTHAPSSVVSTIEEGQVEKSSKRKGASSMVLGSVLGVVGFVVFCYIGYRYYDHIVENKEKDQRRVVYFKEQEALVRANELEREMLMMEELERQHKKAEKKINSERNTRKSSSSKRSRRMQGGAYAVSPAHMQQDAYKSDSSASVVLSSLHSSEVSSDEVDREEFDEHESEHSHALMSSPSGSWEEGPQSEKGSVSSSEREFNLLLDEQSASEGYDGHEYSEDDGLYDSRSADD